ncbi:MAG: DNA polymerase III subunit alpha, partial [Rhodospirillales bacterium]|nr:DNA polymerase III subunit alpha [Rhodospirillales bacterium]
MPHQESFVHLRVHTAYSLLEGALKVKNVVGLCHKAGMPALAMTDTANLFGALEFSVTCADQGIQPIIGCQLNLIRQTGARGEDDGFKGSGGGPGGGVHALPDQIVLLVQNEAGYENLLALVSKSHLSPDGEGGEVQVSLDTLEAHAEGLIALTGGPRGGVGRLLGEGQRDGAEVLLERLVASFPGRLYVELMRHGLDDEKRIEEDLLDLAYGYDLPLIATNECFFDNAAMFEAHDALICIAEGSYVSQPDRRRLSPEHGFKSAAEMRELFADLPDAVDNTLVVAKRCAFMAEPRKPMLPSASGGDNEAGELAELAQDGLESRLARDVWAPGMDEAAREASAHPYRERLDYELGVIDQMGFPGYFLIVADFVQWTKKQGIAVGPGRGSGAGSVVAWSLTITDLDPLRFGLLFERFLNPERVSMPDFDIDFCQDRRDEVIKYVQDKYGEDKVAQIITFGSLQPRAALRDVGRVLQMPYPQVDRLCKLVPNNPAAPVTLEEAIKGEPLLKAARDEDESVKKLFEIAGRLEGLYRHASTHAAGVVIGDRPLEKLVPLYRDPKSTTPVTQFAMKWAEMAGLVKFDFLGLKTLTVLEKALEHLRERDIGIDLAHIPFDDERTFEMLGLGDTTGVFQLESSGMRDILRNMKPDSFEDIIAIVALFRPGPMDNIPSYIKRKHGEEEPDYLYPSLEGILKETNGIMIYQEQVMQIAQELAGYTLGGADVLRRAMGKKIKAEMRAQRKTFVEGAMARGVVEQKASDIFDQVAKFAGYGFNKSHAAAYAVIAYQTAYLKANYPVEFLAASMTLDMSNTDKLGTFHLEL